MFRAICVVSIQITRYLSKNSRKSSSSPYIFNIRYINDFKIFRQYCGTSIVAEMPEISTDRATSAGYKELVKGPHFCQKRTVSEQAMQCQ